jgi:hypothetical protein
MAGGKQADTIWRVSVLAGGGALLTAFALLYLEFPRIYFAALTAWGLAPFRFPFLDTHAVLSALECTRRGFDTYLLDPCDVLTRAFTYSPLLLEAVFLPVSTAWNNLAGLALAVGFILGVASLPAPSRTAAHRAIVALAIVSTMSLFALERGNIDIAIFLLVILAGHLLRGQPAARAAAYLLILLAALLKYYPLAALLAAWRERPRRLFAIALLTAAALAVFILHYRTGLREAMTRVPDGSYFTDFFGAVNLPFGLARLLSPLNDDFPSARRLFALLPWAVLVLLFASCVARARHSFAAAEHGLRALPEAEHIFLGIGAVLIVGCFFAGQSLGYRGIFFLMVLPGLMAMSRAAGGRPFFVTALMILFLMWGEMFRQALQHLAAAAPGAAPAIGAARVAFWMARELVWWRVIATLLGLVLCLAAQSESGAALRQWLLSPRRAPQ